MKYNIFIFSFLLFLVSCNCVSASWLNDNYDYRKNIILKGNTSGAQTDYQVLLNVTYESGMQLDFDDLRFCNETHQLDAWLESKVDSSYALVWVEFPTTPANGVNQTYYMYYGNAGAASNWDGGTTFSFFDDFSAGNFNKWFTAETPTIADGIATINSANEGILGNNGYGTGYSWRSRYNCNITQGTGKSMEGWNTAILSTDTPYEVFNAFTSSPYRRTLQSGAPVTENLDATYLGSYHIYEIMRGGAASTLFNIDDVLKRTSSASNTGTLYPNYMMYGDDGGQIDIDWVFVRKYAANPPTYTFGSEEYYTPPTTIVDETKLIMSEMTSGLKSINMGDYLVYAFILIGILLIILLIQILNNCIYRG